MAINRAPYDLLIDDSGLNADGTPWNKNQIKTVLLDPVDAELTRVDGVWGNWTPQDKSGAALVFSTALGRYWKSGKLVKIWGHVVYPATGDASSAIIGNLPFANNVTLYLGFYITFGVPANLHLPINATQFYLLNPANGAYLPNSSRSGTQVIFQGDYYTE